MHVCDHACSHFKQSHKTGTSKAEQILLFPINSSWRNGSIIFPGPHVMSINTNGIQAGALTALTSGSQKRLVSALGGVRTSILWAQPPGWGQSAICHYSHVCKSLKKAVCVIREAREESKLEMCCGFGTSLCTSSFINEKFQTLGIPGWLSDLAPAIGSGPDPGVPRSSPASGFLHGACFSFGLSLPHSLSLCLS